MNEKELYEILKVYNSIIIYGAGYVGRIVIKRILQQVGDEVNIQNIATSEECSLNKTILGVPVKQITELISYKDKAVVLIATLPNHHKDITNLLSGLGFRNIMPLPKTLIDKMQQKTMDYTIDIIQNISDLSEKLERKISFLDNKMNKILANQRVEKEIMWSVIFNNVISNSSWLKDKGFAPGRWAVGYSYLYVMYRILDDFCPDSILDIGFGQTSKMICQYINSKLKANHIIIESDPEWINFFSRQIDSCERTEMKILDYIYEKHGDSLKEVRKYQEFTNVLSGKKFNFISIDAPHGGDMDEFSRVDIVNILPKCLEESFVIMLDDVERIGERNTALEIDRILQNSDIDYVTAIYSGEKDFRVWTSSDLKYFCSL